MFLESLLKQSQRTIFAFYANGQVYIYIYIYIYPVLFKWFENVLLELYDEHLISRYLQFGFKEKLGCPSAMFLFIQLIEFFNSRSINVYIASLDACTTLDRSIHYRLK